MMFTAILELIKFAGGGVIDHFKDKRELKKAVTKAKIVRVQKSEDSEQAWDKIMAEGSQNSIKDELWTVVLMIPLVMAFIPSLAPYVEQGFTVLDESVPQWYKMALGVAIGAAFGFRKMAGRIGGWKK